MTTDEIASPATARLLGRRRRPQWLVPAGLILLTLVPAAAGAMRLSDIAGGELTAQNARFLQQPVPVVMHIIGACVYCLVGAFQFVPGIRGRFPRWHRGAGRVLVVCGLAAAGSGIWMAVFYDLPDGDGELLLVFRLIFGFLMIAGLFSAVAAIRRGDVRRHRGWMMRAYAIGQGAGTQAVLFFPLLISVGEVPELPRALIMAAGWVLNLLIAELAVRRTGSITPGR